MSKLLILGLLCASVRLLENLALSASPTAAAAARSHQSCGATACNEDATGAPAALKALLPHPDDDCYFLDWVRLHAVGFTAQETHSLVRLVCESGASREPELHQDITHILVSSSASYTLHARACWSCAPWSLTELKPHIRAINHSHTSCECPSCLV